MKQSLRDFVRILVPPAVGMVGAVLLFRHKPISILGVSLFLVFCLSWSLAAWMRSQILSEVFQTFWWGAGLVFSLRGDKSGGFYPLMCGGMFILSVYVLRQAFHERSH